MRCGRGILIFEFAGSQKARKFFQICKTEKLGFSGFFLHGYPPVASAVKVRNVAFADARKFSNFWRIEGLPWSMVFIGPTFLDGSCVAIHIVKLNPTPR